MNHPGTVPTKIDASPIRTQNTTVEPPTPHVLCQLEALLLLLLLLLFPEVGVGVGPDGVEDGEGDSEDDSIEDKDEGGGGNEIDVPEAPALQNFWANCSPVKSSCVQLPVKHEMMLCLNPSLQYRQKPNMRSVIHEGERITEPEMKV